MKRMKNKKIKFKLETGLPEHTNIYTINSTIIWRKKNK